MDWFALAGALELFQPEQADLQERWEACLRLIENVDDDIAEVVTESGSIGPDALLKPVENAG